MDPIISAFLNNRKNILPLKNKTRKITFINILVEDDQKLDILILEKMYYLLLPENVVTAKVIKECNNYETLLCWDMARS